MSYLDKKFLNNKGSNSIISKNPFLVDDVTKLIYAKRNNGNNTSTCIGVVNFAEDDGLECVHGVYLVWEIFSHMLWKEQFEPQKYSKKNNDKNGSIKQLELSDVKELAKRFGIGIQSATLDSSGYCRVHKADAFEVARAQAFVNIIRLDRLRRLTAINFYDLGLNVFASEGIVQRCVPKVRNLFSQNIENRLTRVAAAEQLRKSCSKKDCPQDDNMEKKLAHANLCCERLDSIMADVLLATQMYLNNWLQTHKNWLIDRRTQALALETHDLAAHMEEAMYYVNEYLKPSPEDYPELYPWPPIGGTSTMDIAWSHPAARVGVRTPY